MTHPDQFEDELQIFSSYDEPEELFDAPEDDAPPTELAERIDHTTAPSGSSVNCFPFQSSVLFLAILQCVQLFEWILSTEEGQSNKIWKLLKA